MKQFHFSTPLRIGLRAGVTVVLCVFLCSVAFGQAAQPAPSKEAGARVTETQVDGAIKGDAALKRCSAPTARRCAS
jgi:hypothetical protein